MRSCQGNILSPYTCVARLPPPFMFLSLLPHLLILPVSTSSKLHSPTPASPPSAFSASIIPRPGRLHSYPSFTHYLFTLYGTFLHSPLFCFIYSLSSSSSTAFTFPLRLSPLHPSLSIQTVSPHDYNPGEVEVVPCRSKKNTSDTILSVLHSSPRPELPYPALAIMV